MEVMPSGTRCPAAVRRAFGPRSMGCKAKTPPSGRGGVLRPAAAPGEETRLRVRSCQFARARFRSRVRIYLMRGGGGRKHFIEVVADVGVAFTCDFFETPALDCVCAPSAG